MRAMRYLAADVGGTFTDLVLDDTGAGAVHLDKLPSQAAGSRAGGGGGGRGRAPAARAGRSAASAAVVRRPGAVEAERVAAAVAALAPEAVAVCLAFGHLNP